MTTLEEVFLHLGEEEEVEEDEEEEGGCSWFRGRKIRSSNEDLSHRVLNRYPQDFTHWSAAPLPRAGNGYQPMSSGLKL
jgi:hypothetical protein